MSIKRKYSGLSEQAKMEVLEKLNTLDSIPADGSKAKRIKELCDELGVSARTLYNWKDKLRVRFGGKLVDNGMKVKGRSTLLDANGNVKIQWVKEFTEEQDRIKMFTDAIKNASKKSKAVQLVEAPEYADKDNMTIYAMGDAHIGLLSWQAETGEGHDLEMGETDLVQAVKLLTAQSMPTEECFIIDVGDYFHSDNNMNKTAKSGNSLDVDGRYAKVLEVGLRLTTELIELALLKHKTVRWRSAIGNHNEHSAIMLNAYVRATFRNNPRVIVHDEPGMFMYHRFGKNLIGVTHGHTVKPDKLGNIMSMDCREDWSKTEYAYWYTGHVHHLQKKEYENCIVETFRSLVPKDAWHHESGYRSLRDMQAITLHKDFGEISRNTAGIRMVRAGK